MVQLVDTDESNTIDFQEFLTLMALRIKQPFTEEEVMDAFLVRPPPRPGAAPRLDFFTAPRLQEFDEEETGLISEDTLRNMMTRILPHPMSEDDLQEMLDIAHPNEDGMIEYKNFVKKMFEV